MLQTLSTRLSKLAGSSLTFPRVFVCLYQTKTKKNRFCLRPKNDMICSPIFFDFGPILAPQKHLKIIQNRWRTSIGAVLERFRSRNRSQTRFSPISDPKCRLFVDFWTSKYRCWEPRPAVFDPHNFCFCQTETQNKTNQPTHTNKQSNKQTKQTNKANNTHTHTHTSTYPWCHWSTVPLGRPGGMRGAFE